MTDDLTSGGASRLSSAHQQWDELAVGWAMHALEPIDEHRFARHLTDCGRCLRTVQETQEAFGEVALALPGEAPPERVKQRLMAAVAAESGSDGPVSPPAEPERRTDPPAAPTPIERRSAGRGTRLLGLLAAAAVVAVLAILVGWNVRLHGQVEDAQASAAIRQELLNQLVVPGPPVTMTAMHSPGDNDAVAMLLVHHTGAKVMSMALEPNDASTQVYVLWGIRAGGSTPIALGTFDVSDTGTTINAVGSVATEFDQYDEYAISLEPGDAPPPAPTDQVAMGTVER